MREALFLATVKAAPAASAAASAGDDWKWLVPVATLILGFGLKWLQDHLTEKGRRRHAKELRREQRYDALRMRRIDAERANLISVQPLLLKLMRTAAVFHLEDIKAYDRTGEWGTYKLPPQVAEDFRLAIAEVVPIHARIHTRTVYEQLSEYWELLYQVTNSVAKAEARALWEQVHPIYDRLHIALGDEIRKLEDENLQLGDPSAR